MRRGWLAVSGMLFMSACGGSNGTSVPVCGGVLELPFDAEVFDFGERFGEADGDTVLSVISRNGETKLPALGEIEALIASEFRIVAVVEDEIAGRAYTIGAVAEDGCEFSVGAVTDSFALSRRDFDRSWYLAVVERGPAVTA